jgi:membrane protein implicated in regulation of membrane protease activity
MLHMTPLNTFYLVCACAGFALLLVRIILMAAGAGHGADADSGADVHADISHDFSAGHDVPAGHDLAPGHDMAAGHDATSGHGHGAGHHADSDASFKMLTLQGVMGFLLMFGLTGFVLNGITFAGGIISAAGAITAGIASMWIIAKFFSLLMKLQSSGTVDIANAVGQEGTVYLTIPQGGVGKVQVVVQGRLLEYEAVSDAKEALVPGDTILVVYYKGNTLVVHKI